MREVAYELHFASNAGRDCNSLQYYIWEKIQKTVSKKFQGLRND